MKKLVSSVLAASMVLSLAACGSSASTDTASSSEAASTSTAATAEAAGEGSGAYTGTPIKIGGIGPITVVAVLITGIFGSIAAPLLIKLFRVKDPMTAGLAIGASSHAVGTSKALELGETEGAMSGLAIGVCGLITVVLSLFLM